jgi:hypothetical protein
MTVELDFPRREMPATVARAAVSCLVVAAVAARPAAVTIPAAHTEHHLAAAAVADRHEAAIAQALAVRSAAFPDTAGPALLMVARLEAQARWHAEQKTSWSSQGHTRQPLHSPGAFHR